MSGPTDCAMEKRKLGILMGRLGIVKHEEKGEWEGSRQVDHLGLRIDTDAMRVYVTARKVRHVKSLARKIIIIDQRNRRLVPLKLLRHFCGVCVSLSLALPLARF